MIPLRGVTTDRVILSDDIVDRILPNAVVAMGVSGGKDSCALALALNDWLDTHGHNGKRLLIHSDLGSVEWKDSLPTCERLAKATGLELVVVQRKAGGMMERWRSRWDNCVHRYCNLECVKLILPWSTPAMRFCTAELKRDVICSYLRKRFVGRKILSCSGIRRDESKNREKSPVISAQPKLVVKTKQTIGYDWNPMLSWTHDDVFNYLDEKRFPLHEAYTKYGMSRVSCAFCIMSSAGDLLASTSCDGNVAIYRTMVDLEIESAFSFQGSTWLGDVAPHLLSPSQAEALKNAKKVAHAREAIESTIPDHLLYSKGWPTCIPTHDESVLLATIRRQVSSIQSLPAKYLTASDVHDRYAELYNKKHPNPTEMI